MVKIGRVLIGPLDKSKWAGRRTQLGVGQGKRRQREEVLGRCDHEPSAACGRLASPPQSHCDGGSRSLQLSRKRTNEGGSCSPLRLPGSICVSSVPRKSRHHVPSHAVFGLQMKSPLVLASPVIL